jgi:uncharacterized protein
MLTGDLVRARVRDGEIKPIFVDPEAPRWVERAEALLEIFRGAMGKARVAIDEEVDQLIGDGVDRKLTEGLVKVLTDRAEFETAAPVDPVEIRRRIFALAAERGPVAPIAVEGGPPTAAALWAELGATLGHAPEALEAALYADFPESQVLRALDVPNAAWLLHRYNVALAQALLLHAASVDIRLVGADAGRLRQLLRAVKFHQLLFSAHPVEGGYRLHIDGPASLFSQTTRYGLALAKFFPALLLQTGWTLSAEIEWRNAKPRLKLDPAAGLRSHYRDAGAWRPKEVDWLAERFAALESGWEIVHEPTPIVQGSEGVVVPDLSFRKGGRIAHIEVLGFWKKKTIPKRLELLRTHGPPNLILAVSKRMCAEAGEALPDVVIPFAEVVPAKEVLRRVELVAQSSRATTVSRSTKGRST